MSDERTTDAYGPEAVIEAQLATLTSRFGERLSSEEWDGVRAAIATQRQRAAKLRAVPVRNGDEPATIFEAGMRRD